MIKSKIKEDVVDDIGFPKLVQHPNNKSIILIDEHGKGTVLHVGSSCLKLGQIGDWALHLYEDFTGTLELSNKD